MFGMYATTGRAVSFLAPGLFALLAGAFDNDRMGIIGIAFVLLIGALALWRVNPPPRPASYSGTRGRTGTALRGTTPRM